MCKIEMRKKIKGVKPFKPGTGKKCQTQKVSKRRQDPKKWGLGNFYCSVKKFDFNDDKSFLPKKSNNL